MNESAIVIDTSVLFSFLLKEESVRRKRFLTDSDLNFHSPHFVFVELFKHKERIVRASALEEKELLDCLYGLMVRIRFLEEGAIPIGTWFKAHRLCREIDPKDTPFVALALHLDGRLWTDDLDLTTGLQAKGFSRFFTG